MLSEEFAHIKKFQVHLKLKPNAKPVFIKNCTVPLKALEKVEKELENMIKAGILEKVESSNWATPIVPILKKNSGVRICVNFSVTVNPSLIIAHNGRIVCIDVEWHDFFENRSQAYLQLPVAEFDS